LARFFPTTGGILKTMHLDAPGYSYLALDGVENCISALKDIERGLIHKCFIEMSSCAGSCIGGPVMEKYHKSPVRDYASISRFAGNQDFDIAQPVASSIRKMFDPIAHHASMPSEEKIKEIMKEMGKTSPEMELNCGSCGYNSCREKAIAIYQGKAEISMCLPYLKDKAETLSDSIVNNTPNGIIVLNDQLEVQQINSAAMKIMNLNSATAILGDNVVRILDPIIFLEVMESGKGVYNESVYLTEYNRYVEQTVVPTDDGRMLLYIMRDITDEQKEKKKKEELSRQTVEVADRVVDKQMRIVQEIASLLGETAAETKIALSKLKESITDE
ncbi:MAG: histidine kinase, partial [Clostridia bacterium]|nr:histidine kinase [Clostridia bacterium]